VTLQDFVARDWQQDATAFVPVLFQLAAGERERLEQLAADKGITLRDTLSRQLAEWVRIELPTEPAGSATAQALLTAEGQGEPAPYASYGYWCYLPWRRVLTHLLPPHRYFAVRTNRNRDKITLAEQTVLRQKRVGVVGLSVGHSAAMVLAQEGLCGELRIADFDTLDLSNLNRLRTSIAQLGDAKVHIARRDLAEIDPYLPVRTFEQGITDDNIEEGLRAVRQALLEADVNFKVVREFTSRVKEKVFFSGCALACAGAVDGSEGLCTPPPPPPGSLVFFFLSPQPAPNESATASMVRANFMDRRPE